MRTLRQNFDAYAVNIDGFGHRLEPAIDFEAENADARQDLETTGNAYWEVLRDGRGESARLIYLPSHTVRLMPLDAEPVEVEDRVQVSPRLASRPATSALLARLR